MGTTFEAAWRRAGLEGIRSILLSEPARDILHQRVAGMLCEGVTLRALRMRRAALKPKRGLRASFTATLEGVTGGAVTRPLSVVWLVQHPGSGAPDSSPLNIPERVAAPFRRLRDYEPDGAIDIWAWPFDPTFAQLARAADPEYAGGLLSALERAPWTRRNGAECTVTPVRYVPRRSHVLRYDPPGPVGPPGPGTLFVKLYADPVECALRRETIVAAAAALEELDVGRAASPIGDSAGAGILLYPWVEGASLAHHLRDGDPETGDMLRSLGAAAGALQRLPARAELPSRSLGLVIAGATHAASHLDTLLPFAAGVVRRLLATAEQCGERVTAEPPVLVHGDLKLEHARVTDPRRITLIDLDSLARAEPALDLGQLLADIRWEFFAAGRVGFAEAQERFLEGYRDSGDLPQQRLQRARIHELVVFVRSAMRRVNFLQPAWEDRMQAALAAASAFADELP
jgi:aminoglycoside phosphotransferase (APT) family kinase protein